MFSTLMKSLEEGHHVFVDRYYTTAKLIDYLSSKKCHYTGTLNLNRKKNFVQPQYKLCNKVDQMTTFYGHF